MKSDEKIDFEYPWHERPDDVPIVRRELEIILSTSDWDVAKAAKALRTRPERVVAALNAPGNEALARRVAEKVVSGLITILRWDWAEIDIAICKPAKGYTLRTSIDENGNLRVKITKDGTEDLLRLAETIVAEAENAPGLRPSKPPRATPEERAEAARLRKRDVEMRRAIREHFR